MRFIYSLLFIIAVIIIIPSCQYSQQKNKAGQTHTSSAKNPTFTTGITDTNRKSKLPVDQMRVVSMLQKGMLLMGVKKYNRALHFFDSAVYLDPANPTVYTDRANAYYMLGDFNKAKNDCNTAYEMDHKNALALYTRAMINLNSGDFANAISDLNNVIDLKPKNAEAYSYRGTAEGASGNINKAEEDFNKAIKLNPKLALAYYNRGVLFGFLKKPKEEMRDYEKALKMQPDYEEARLNMAVVKEKNFKNYKGAISDLDKVIKLNPRNVKAYVSRGRCKQALKNYKAAIDDYTTAIKINPQYKPAYAKRSDAYAAIGDKINAQKDQAMTNTLK